MWEFVSLWSSKAEGGEADKGAEEAEGADRAEGADKTDVAALYIYIL